MRRTMIFSLILAVSIIGFTASFYLLMVSFQTQPTMSSMAGIMGRMMGGLSPGTQEAGSQVPPYFLILPPVFIVTLILGALGFIYFLMVPEIKVSKMISPAVNVPMATQIPKNEKISMLAKTMKPDEEKVLTVLTSHEGKYLQKHISKEAGLSRLKTHRIVARFAERGIVTVRPFGNSNEVALSNWLMSKENSDKKVEGEASS
ncbi:MAG: hypothetical protein HYU39_09650 [Thaumarchaeota archaeon]|nr:hypothetical protein [Nitrososphaerota archaeon]